MLSFDKQRADMVDRHIAARGIRDERVLESMRRVPRETFVGDRLAEFAYEDTPLPIEEGQTISQPYVVALMLEALELSPESRVLEVGSGSGYVACLLAEIAQEVCAIERHENLVHLARRRAEQLGYTNVHFLHGDGTLGWPDRAPFDAVVVAAGGPDVPQSLLDQLNIGGRLVIPVGKGHREQELLRIRRTGEHTFDRESLGQVRFVPLIGSEGWMADGVPAELPRPPPKRQSAVPVTQEAADLVRECCEPFQDIESCDLSPLLERIGDSRVVLIGESTHGTSEFYAMRARITRELIRNRGFNVVAIEGDWPDTNVLDGYARGRGRPSLRSPAFSRFPTWMWRNEEVRQFVHWLAEHNAGLSDPGQQVSIRGLDIYSLNNSIGAVLDYLDDVDPKFAAAARVRYGCLSPWETDPATYGRAAVAGRLRSCEEDVVATLLDLFERRMDYLEQDGERFFDAEQNARVVRDAEHYYRVMHLGAAESWNLRDRHMFYTLQAVLAHQGEDARAVVWAHNSHVGDARATEISARGELNLGQLAREAYREQAYLLGFGTDHGTVAAASNWDEPVANYTVRPSHPQSYEHLFHRTGVEGFFLPLRHAARSDLREELATPRLQRAIGVVYRPETELLSHYFQSVRPAQYDEYIWMDKTSAVHPIDVEESPGVPDTYPFGV